MRDLFVSVDGDDTADGTESSPLRTITKALDLQDSGDRILIGDGTYLEAPLLAFGVEQGQLKAQNRGEVRVEFENPTVSAAGLITLHQCRHYIIDGLILDPPDNVLVPDGTGGDFNSTAMIAITGGEGNLVTDTVLEFWRIEEVKSSFRVNGIFATDCDRLKIQRTEVRGIHSTFTPGFSALGIPGGSIYGIRVENIGSATIFDTRVSSLSAINGNVGGILAGLESAALHDVVRIAGCSVREVSTHGQAGEGLDLCTGIGAFGLQNGVNLSVKNCKVFVVRSTHDNELLRTQTSAYRLSGARNATLRNLLGYRADRGVQADLVGFSSKWDNLTFDRVDTGIFLFPSTSNPVRVILRNILLNRLTTGIKTLGNVLIDIDFVNINELAELLFDVDGLFAEHVELGPSLYRYNPRFVAPDDTNRDFALEFISPLINLGTDL